MGEQTVPPSGAQPVRSVAPLHGLHGRGQVEEGEAAGGEGRICGRQLLQLHQCPARASGLSKCVSLFIFIYIWGYTKNISSGRKKVLILIF